MIKVEIKPDKKRKGLVNKHYKNNLITWSKYWEISPFIQAKLSDKEHMVKFTKQLKKDHKINSLVNLSNRTELMIYVLKFVYLDMYYQDSKVAQ